MDTTSEAVSADSRDQNVVLNTEGSELDRPVYAELDGIEEHHEDEARGSQDFKCEGLHRDAVGFVDVVTDTQVGGWAWIPAAVDQSVMVSIRIGGETYKKARASTLRPDLREAQIGTGQYGFTIRLDGPINWKNAEVRVDGCNGDMQGGSTSALVEKIEDFRACQKAKRVLTYYPDYSFTNPYQTKLAASLPSNWESSAGTIDDAIDRIRASNSAEKHLFHLHWVNPVISGAPNRWAAERQKDLFIAKLHEYAALGGTLVWTIHNVLSHDKKHEDIERQLCQEVAELATKVHVHSSLVLKEIERDYVIRPDKVVVLQHPEYIGVYPNYIPSNDARRKLGISRESTVFAFVGQLRPYKGLNELVDAFRELQKAYSSVHLLIAGSPVYPYSPEKIRLLTSGIDECTLVTEFVPDNQLQIYFNACDFVVLPYRNVLTSGSVMNALSFSRPVIAPRLGVLPETIVDGENGWLYEPTDKQALLLAMKNCIDSDVLATRQQLFDNCRRSIEHLTWHDFGQRLSAEVELRLEPEWVDIDVGGKKRHVQVVRSRHDRTKRRDVAIVILNYEHYDDVQRLVESVEAGTGKDVEFFIVDNDSQNMSFSEFVSFVPKSGAPTTYMRVDHNGGYALGNNIGITQALKQEFDFVWVVNPDIVMEKGAIEALCNSAMKNPESRLFGSTIYAGGTDGKIWSAGGRLNFDNGLDVSHLYGGMEKSTLPESAYPVDYITGASLFCRSSIFDAAGLIPEDYFLYFEETDWCLRLRMNGETILVEPGSELTHFKQSESGSLPSTYYFYYYIRNALIFTLKNEEKAYEKTLAALQENFISPWLKKIERRSLGKLEQYENIVRSALQDAKARRQGYRDLNEIMFPHSAVLPSIRAVGNLEHTDRETVTGWAYDPENGEACSELAVTIDGRLVGNVTARSQLRRSDLQNAGLGGGDCGFRFQFPRPIADLKRHTVEVAFVNGASIGKDVLVASAHVDYRGRIEGISGYTVRGWAYNSGNGNESPTVEVWIDDEVVVSGRASLYRVDLLNAGIGNGCHGFEIRLPASKLDGLEHSLELKLPGSEIVLAKQVVRARPVVASLPMDGLQQQLAWMSEHREFAFASGERTQISDFYRRTELALVRIGSRQENIAKVSIIMPAFNREETIKASIRSVMDQSYSNYELIIVDDGSTDGTAKVVRKFSKEVGQSRIRLISMDANAGVSAARNVGLRSATGDLVAYLDSDNTWNTDFLMVMTTGFLMSPDVDSAYCGQTVFQVVQTPDGKIEDPVMVRAGPFSLALIENRNYVDLNCFVHKRSVFEKLGGFNEDVRRLVDWELIWRYGYVKTPKFIPALLSNYFMAKAENQITSLENYSRNFETIQKVLGGGRKTLDEHVLAAAEEARALHLVMLVEGCDHPCLDTSIGDAVAAIRGTSSHLTILMSELEQLHEPLIGSLAGSSNVTFRAYRDVDAESLMKDIVEGASHDLVLLSGNASIQPNTLRHLCHAAEISKDAGLVMSKRLKKMKADELALMSTYASAAIAFDQTSPGLNVTDREELTLNHVLQANTDELFCAFVPRQALLDVSLEGIDFGNRNQLFRTIADQLVHLHGLKCYQAGRAIAHDIR